MKPVFLIFNRLVTGKGEACCVLTLLCFILSACSGEPPGSTHNKPEVDAQAAGSVFNSEGEKLFRLRCGVCHSVDPDRPSVAGPRLTGVIDNTAGSVAGFAYSEAMRAYGKTWTEENLDRFLENPNELVPDNRMAFVGMSNAEQRKLIIEYLKIFR